MTRVERQSFLGVSFDRTTLVEAAEHVRGRVESGVGGWVLTPNTSILRQLTRPGSVGVDPHAADLVLLDGRPVKWLSSLAGIDLGDVVTGADLLPAVMKRLDRSASVAFIGGAPGVAEMAAQKAREHGFTRVGHHCPPVGFGSSQKSLELECATTVLTWADPPRLVVMALPFPLQERTTAQLQTLWPDTYFLGVGAAMSFWVGQLDRPPLWMRRAGLEWLGRLMQEPRKLVGRYLGDDLPFLTRLLGRVLLARLTGRSERLRGDGRART